MSEPIGTYTKPKDGWVCFHCGERFMEPSAAREHFGETPDECLRLRERVRVLETASRTAEDGAALARALAGAENRASRFKSALYKLCALHHPFGIWDDCGHDYHKPGDPRVWDIPDVGLTCAKMYDICDHCCRDDESQGEECANEHDHGPGKPICMTRAIVDAALSDSTKGETT